MEDRDQSTRTRWGEGITERLRLERREGETQTVSAERYDELLKELERKNAALAEAAAHLFLVKKVSRILGGEK